MRLLPRFATAVLSMLFKNRKPFGTAEGFPICMILFEYYALYQKLTFSGSGFWQGFTSVTYSTGPSPS